MSELGSHDHNFRPSTLLHQLGTTARKHAILIHIYPLLIHLSGPVSSVGKVTDYGLEGPGSNLGGDEILRTSRPALGPIQPPVQWVPCLSRG